tara:strand:- start:312 stop:743 length:432 start_codon:yes stop_codon:yes gene_type:complete
MSFKFIIYSTPTCPYCIEAKDLITSQEFEYTEISLDTPEKVDEFKAKGFKTVPQIYLDTEEQELIGGYEDLEKFMLEMVDWRRKQAMFGSGGMSFDPKKTIHIRQGKDGSTTVTEEDRAKEYNITITEKQEMKDITPEKNDDR